MLALKLSPHQVTQSPQAPYFHPPSYIPMIVSLRTPGCSGTCSAGQAGLEFQDPIISTSPVQGFTPPLPDV